MSKVSTMSVARSDTATGAIIGDMDTNKQTVASAYPLLSKIKSPADVKALPEQDIPALCEEIRRCLVETVSTNGGHLASNLGVVELTVAMHRVFDCPCDHFVFDVGHQSYVHKLLTGRFERFDTLRQGGGISGFTNRAESEYDCFGAGHSSTSISGRWVLRRPTAWRDRMLLPWPWWVTAPLPVA